MGTHSPGRVTGPRFLSSTRPGRMRICAGIRIQKTVQAIIELSAVFEFRDAILVITNCQEEHRAAGIGVRRAEAMVDPEAFSLVTAEGAIDVVIFPRVEHINLGSALGWVGPRCVTEGDVFFGNCNTAVKLTKPLE